MIEENTYFVYAEAFQDGKTFQYSQSFTCNIDKKEIQKLFEEKIKEDFIKHYPYFREETKVIIKSISLL